MNINISLRPRLHPITAAVCALLLGACGGSDDPAAASSAAELEQSASVSTLPAPEPAPEPSPGAVDGSCGPDCVETTVPVPEQDAAPVPPGSPRAVGGTYVRPVGAAPLFGMNIGAKNYDDPVYQAKLARLDTVVLGFYPGWKGDKDGSVIRRAVQQLKARKPTLKVGQYTILSESPDNPATTASDDKIIKLDQMNWWLRKANGSKTQWTATYGTYDVNISDWSRRDANGDRYPQWSAKREHRLFFNRVPEFDLWYFDNVFPNSRIPSANWKYNGVNLASKSVEAATAYRRGHAAQWATAGMLAPKAILMGNVNHDMSSPEYRGRLHSGFIEGAMGLSWSLETWAGWAPMMTRYFDTAANLRAPALVGFNVWGSLTNYKFFRYSFASCLMGNGQYSFTDKAAGYSSVAWFDEYEVALGKPIEAATKTVWSNGVYRRRYEKAMVLVNPQTGPRTVQIEAGWRRLLARQDPVTNNGQAVTSITIPAKDGLVLVRR